MMKKVIVLSVLAVSLTGCMVDPWDNDHRDSRDRNGQYDRQHGDRDWKNKDHRDGRHDRNDRNDRNDRGRYSNR